jgi:hypothetical protein
MLVVMVVAALAAAGGRKGEGGVKGLKSARRGGETRVARRRSHFLGVRVCVCVWVGGDGGGGGGGERKLGGGTRGAGCVCDGLVFICLVVGWGGTILCVVLCFVCVCVYI